MGNKISSANENGKIGLKCCNCFENMCPQDIYESPIRMINYSKDERGE